MPEHIGHADRQTLVVLIDKLVVIAGHPADPPVIFDILPGEAVGTQA